MRTSWFYVVCLLPNNVVAVSDLKSVSYSVHDKEFIKGNRVPFLTPVLTLWGCSHIDCQHMEVNYCTFGFGAICTYHHYRMIQRPTTYMRVCD